MSPMETGRIGIAGFAGQKDLEDAWIRMFNVR